MPKVKSQIARKFQEKHQVVEKRIFTKYNTKNSLEQQIDDFKISHKKTQIKIEYFENKDDYMSNHFGRAWSIAEDLFEQQRKENFEENAKFESEKEDKNDSDHENLNNKTVEVESEIEEIVNSNENPDEWCFSSQDLKQILDNSQTSVYNNYNNLYNDFNIDLKDFVSLSQETTPTPETTPDYLDFLNSPEYYSQ